MEVLGCVGERILITMERMLRFQVMTCPTAPTATNVRCICWLVVGARTALSAQARFKTNCGLGGPRSAGA